MPISEGVQSRIVYKAYSSGSITANSEPDTATDPGTSGGQVLRRVSSSLNLVKDSYQSEEIRTDRQITDFRHGLRRVEGSISGELSPRTATQRCRRCRCRIRNSPASPATTQPRPSSSLLATR
jgi:hypothetical protein